MTNFELYKAGKPCLCDQCHQPIEPISSGLINEQLEMIVCSVECVEKHCMAKDVETLAIIITLPE